MRDVQVRDNGMKEGAVQRIRGAGNREVEPRRGESSTKVETEEREIDQTLADSFPASDAPSWTLGVTENPQAAVAKKERNRRADT